MQLSNYPRKLYIKTPSSFSHTKRQEEKNPQMQFANFYKGLPPIEEIDLKWLVWGWWHLNFLLRRGTHFGAAKLGLLGSSVAGILMMLLWPRPWQMPYS
jgi:hypothetical protein